VVIGAIASIWIAIPTFEITMACVFTDIIKRTCAPDSAFSSENQRQTVHVFEFVVAYVLPLTLMVFCYSRVVYALRPKVRVSVINYCMNVLKYIYLLTYLLTYLLVLYTAALR